MPELRRDPISFTWVIFAPDRKSRPQYFEYPGTENFSAAHCPFCEGNEAMTPPEIFALRPKGGNANERDWRLRVVPNKFPALKVEGSLSRRAEGPYDWLSGIGAHEVVIETPGHRVGIEDMDVESIRQIFLTYKVRLLDLKKDIRLKYIQIFKNHGPRAGATIPHAHSQVIALPIIPPPVEARLKTAGEHFDRKERCLICDVLFHERGNRQRLLTENTDFIVTAPYASRFPFELRLFPIEHGARFEEVPDTVFTPLAETLKDTVIRLNRVLDHPDYHWLLVNSPFHQDCREWFHWYLEIVPLVSGTGGFELGTGTYINPIPPEEAVEILKDEKHNK